MRGSHLTQSQPMNGLAKLRLSDQLLPTEQEGMERTGCWEKDRRKPSCRGWGYTRGANPWVLGGVGKGGRCQHCPDPALLHGQAPSNLLPGA